MGGAGLIKKYLILLEVIESQTNSECPGVQSCSVQSKYCMQTMTTVVGNTHVWREEKNMKHLQKKLLSIIKSI